MPTRRGDRTAAHVTVRSFGPLGLAGRQRRHQVPWSVRVLPPFTSRKFLPEKLARLRELDGAVTLNRRGQGTEFDSLREYVDGDDVRSIDWRATARRGDVVVRTWRPERDRRLVCVLDTGRTSAARVGDMPRLDAAMDACLLLAAVAARAGDRVDLLAADSVVRASVEAASRNEVLPTLVQAMAPLEPALVESDAQLIAAEVLRRERKRALVVLFTSLDAEPIEQGLLPVLGGLTSRHTVVLAAVGDPRVAELAARRGDTAAVYDAAAAERALAERRRVMGAAAPARGAARRRARGHVRVRGRRRVPGAQGGRPALSSGPCPAALQRGSSPAEDVRSARGSGDGSDVLAQADVEVAGLAGPDGTPAVPDDVGEERRLGQRADADPGPRRQRRRRHERLDHAAHRQHARPVRARP